MKQTDSIRLKILDRLAERIGNYILEVKRNYYRRKLHVEKLNIYFPVFISNLENLKLGENCAIASFVHIWSIELVHIGENTAIAAHVQITTSTHDYNHRPYRNRRIDKPVTIGKNVWIGSGAIIMPGVTIGDNSVIGAGSVVTKNIPEDTLAYGVPARIIKKLTTNSGDHSDLGGGQNGN